MTTTLLDGRVVEIRPLDEVDRSALLAFGRALPQDDLLEIENDFANPDMIARLVNARFDQNWRQIVASIGDQVIGYGMARRLPGWSSHVASIGLLVSAGWRRSGLGTALLQATIDVARDLDAEKLIVEMLDSQVAGRTVFDHQGFRVEGRLSDHARDRKGQCRTLIVMAYHMQ
jgi:GNAT superfamily N-acetyltransferase